MTATLSDVLKYIRTDADSHELKLIQNEIVTAIRKERTLKASEVRQQLKPGVKVRVTDGVKPRYFIGRIGEVLDIQVDRARVDFGAPMRRYGRIVGMPLSCLEIIDGE